MDNKEDNNIKGEKRSFSSLWHNLRKSSKIIICSLFSLAILSSIVFPILSTFVWNKKADDYFVVKFDTNGGSIIDSQNIKKGSKVNRPGTDPVKNDYIFDNWYTSNTFETLYNFDNTIIEDTTIYASWKPVIHAKSIELNFKEVGALVDVPYIPVKATVLPLDTLNKSVSWYSSNESYATVNKDTGEVHAHKVTGIDKYIEIKCVSNDINEVFSTYKLYTFNTGHLVTFNPNNGEEPFYQYVYDGETVDKPTINPFKSCYDFTYWVDDKGNPWNFDSSVVNDDITLNASYSCNLTLEEKDDKYSIKDFGTNKESNLVIPDQINSKDIVEIGNNAFANDVNLVEIKLNSKITTIGNYAFKNCPNLLNVNVLSKIDKIGEEAFISSSKLNINWPSEYNGTFSFSDLTMVGTKDYYMSGKIIQSKPISFTHSGEININSDNATNMFTSYTLHVNIQQPSPPAYDIYYNGTGNPYKCVLIRK